MKILYNADVLSEKTILLWYTKGKNPKAKRFLTSRPCRFPRSSGASHCPIDCVRARRVSRAQSNPVPPRAGSRMATAQLAIGFRLFCRASGRGLCAPCGIWCRDEGFLSRIWSRSSSGSKRRRRTTVRSHRHFNCPPLTIACSADQGPLPEYPGAFGGSSLLAAGCPERKPLSE